MIYHHSKILLFILLFFRYLRIITLCGNIDYLCFSCSIPEQVLCPLAVYTLFFSMDHRQRSILHLFLVLNKVLIFPL
jgi:hypothetical protein